LRIKISDISCDHFKDEVFFIGWQGGDFFELVNEFSIGERLLCLALGITPPARGVSRMKGMDKFFSML